MLNPDKISTAVSAGIVRCIPARLPIAELSLYLTELRTSANWSSMDLHAVEKRMRRFLIALAKEG